MPNGYPYKTLPQEYSQAPQPYALEDPAYNPALGGGNGAGGGQIAGQIGAVAQFAGEEIGAFGETAQYLAQPLPGVENIYAGIGAEVRPDIAYLQQQQEVLQAMPTGKGIGWQIAAGAAKGAGAGTMVAPGIGTAIGAGVGAIGAGIRGLLGRKKARADIGEMQEELEQARAGFGAQMRRYNELQIRQEMEGVQKMYSQMLRQNIYAR